MKQTTKILYEVSIINAAKPEYREAVIEIGNRPLFKVGDKPIVLSGECKLCDCHGRIHFVEFSEKVEDVYDMPEKEKDKKIIEKMTKKSAKILWDDKQRLNDKSNDEIEKEIEFLKKLKK